jgi:hypothetical protein
MATVTSPSGHRLRSSLSAAGPPSCRCRRRRRRRRHLDRCSCHQDLLPGRCRRCASGRRSGSIERPVQVRPMDSHRRARCRPKGTSLALVLVWPRTRLELRLRRAVARGEGGEFRSCRWQCPSMIRLGVYRGSWSMGFVIQMAAGKAEAEPHTGLLGPADNAAGGQLGAKTAIKTRGTRPSGWRLASSHGGHRSVSPHAPRSGRCPPTRKRWRRPARRPGPTLPTRSGAPR